MLYTKNELFDKGKSLLKKEGLTQGASPSPDRRVKQDLLFFLANQYFI